MLKIYFSFAKNVDVRKEKDYNEEEKLHIQAYIFCRYWRLMVEKIKELSESLETKGYLVECFASKEEAAEYMDKAIDNTSVGIGGSETVRQMGLFELLTKHNTVYWHAKTPENMTVAETRLAATKAAVYISSVNGISMQGDIINIDGTGNRVAGISYGPDDVYFVVGKNKIADDYEAAMYRARNVAAPLNAKRLNRNTPCAVKGDRCYDCKSPERICRNFSIFRECPSGRKYHLILINEELGF